MTIEERYELSCYEEISKLHDTKPVYLVRYNNTGDLYVKKRIAVYNEGIYEKLRQIKVEGIPGIRLCIEDEEQLIVIEEYIHGHSLRDIFDMQGVLEERRVVDIITAVCDILIRLHRENIVHRDVKPSNIMLSNDGAVKLVDFNAAREFAAGIAEDTILMGTQEFAAPEQYGFGQSDQRTDIYALGVTMNYLLTGQYPKQHNYGGAIGKIIDRCTAIDAGARYADVSELRDALKGIYASGWAPIGFRTGKLWKMALAVCGYCFIFWLGLSMEPGDGEEFETGFVMWLDRIAVILWMIGMVFIVGNYREICGPSRDSWKGRLAGCMKRIVFILAYTAVIMFLLVILEDVLI